MEGTPEGVLFNLYPGLLMVQSLLTVEILLRESYHPIIIAMAWLKTLSLNLQTRPTVVFHMLRSYSLLEVSTQISNRCLRSVGASGELLHGKDSMIGNMLLVSAQPMPCS